MARFRLPFLSAGQGEITPEGPATESPTEPSGTGAREPAGVDEEAPAAPRPTSEDPTTPALGSAPETTAGGSWMGWLRPGGAGGAAPSPPAATVEAQLPGPSALGADPPSPGATETTDDLSEPLLPGDEGGGRRSQDAGDRRGRNAAGAAAAAAAAGRVGEEGWAPPLLPAAPRAPSRGRGPAALRQLGAAPYGAAGVACLALGVLAAAFPLDLTSWTFRRVPKKFVDVEFLMIWQVASGSFLALGLISLGLWSSALRGRLAGLAAQRQLRGLLLTAATAIALVARDVGGAYAPVPFAPGLALGDGLDDGAFSLQAPAPAPAPRPTGLLKTGAQVGVLCASGTVALFALAHLALGGGMAPGRLLQDAGAALRGGAVGRPGSLSPRGGGAAGHLGGGGGSSHATTAASSSLDGGLSDRRPLPASRGASGLLDEGTSGSGAAATGTGYGSSAARSSAVTSAGSWYLGFGLSGSVSVSSWRDDGAGREGGGGSFIGRALAVLTALLRVVSALSLFALGLTVLVFPSWSAEAAFGHLAGKTPALVWRLHGAATAFLAPALVPEPTVRLGGLALVAAAAPALNVAGGLVHARGLQPALVAALSAWGLSAALGLSSLLRPSGAGHGWNF